LKELKFKSNPKKIRVFEISFSIKPDGIFPIQKLKTYIYAILSESLIVASI